MTSPKPLIRTELVNLLIAEIRPALNGDFTMHSDLAEVVAERCAEAFDRYAAASPRAAEPSVGGDTGGAIANHVEQKSPTEDEQIAALADVIERRASRFTGELDHPLSDHAARALAEAIIDAKFMFVEELASSLPETVAAQEPVAWRYRWHTPGRVSPWMIAEVEPRAATANRNQGIEIEPLYVSPAPSVSREPTRAQVEALLGEDSDSLDASYNATWGDARNAGIRAVLALYPAPEQT